MNDRRRTPWKGSQLQLNLSEPAMCSLTGPTATANRGNWTPDGSTEEGGQTGDGQRDCFVSAQVPEFYRLAAGQRRFNLCQIRIASSCPTTQPHNASSQATAPEAAAQFQLHIKWRLATMSRILRAEPQTWLGLIIESKLLPLCVAA